MSSVKEVVELLFKTDYAGQPEMLKLKKDVTGLAKSFDTGVRRTAAMTVALGGLEVAALGASIGLAKASAESAGKFKDNFAEISTLITDISDKDLAGFELAIKDYATNSTASLESINGAIYNAISAGVDWKSSLAFLAEAEKLSVAGKADLNDTVKVLTATLNAYGESTDQAGKYSDVLFNTVKNGVTTLPELSSQLGQVTGIAASLNIPFDELSAVIATLTANGLSTGNAITAIKGALTNIIKPTKQASEAAESLGIGFDYAALQSKGFSGLMGEIATKSTGNSEAVTKLFGSVEGLNAALSLTSDKGAQAFIDKLAEMQNSTGATEDAFQKMMENTALLKQTLANNLELTLVDIGTPILDEFHDIDKAIIEIFKTIRSNLDNDSTLGAVTNAVDGVAKTVADIIRNMADNLDDSLGQADLSGFVGAFEAIDAALKGLDVQSTEGLSDAISTLGNAFEGLTKFTVAAGEVFSGLIGVIADIGSALNLFDGDVVSFIGTAGGWAIALSTVSLALSPVLALIKSAKKLGGLAGALGDVPAATKNLAAFKAGLASVAAVYASSFGEWVVAESGIFGQTAKEIETAVDQAGPEMIKLFKEWQVETGKLTATYDEYTAAMVKKRREEENSKNAVDDLMESQKKLNGASAPVSDQQLESFRQYGDVVLDAEGNILEFTISSRESSAAIGDHDTQLKKTIQSFDTLGSSAKDAKNDLKGIDVLKLNVSLESDKIKAEAEKVKAIMDGLSSTGSAVADSIAAGFNSIGTDGFNNLDFFQKDDVIESIKVQSEAQKKLAEAQEKVATAQANYMNAKAKQMSSGKGLIQIDGTRLEPELEAFMLRIIEFTQVRLAEEQSGFLLGIESL